MASITERMVGAALLNIRTYEEVEADTSATGQAVAVVLLSSIAQGIGNLGHGGRGLISGLIFALIGWFIWACLCYFIGVKVFPEPQTKSDVGELMRTTGFASAPGVLRVLAIIPIFGRLILLVVNLWMLVAMVIAVRQALDYKSTGRAIGVCLIGFAIYVVIGMAISLL